jgi:hypothetical protein
MFFCTLPRFSSSGGSFPGITIHIADTEDELVQAAQALSYPVAV